MQRLGEREADVVAVANPGNAEPFDRAEALPHRLQVGERLQRMRLVGERVEDRDRRRRSEHLELRMGVGANRDRVEVAGEHAGGVLERLAARELELVVRQVERGRAEVGRRDLERDTRPRRVLAEEQTEGAPFEQAVRLARALLRLQLVGEVEHGLELGGGPVADAGERAPAQVDSQRLRQRDGHVSPSR